MQAERKVKVLTDAKRVIEILADSSWFHDAKSGLDNQVIKACFVARDSQNLLEAQREKTKQLELGVARL